VADENEKDKDSAADNSLEPPPKRFIPNPFAKLTDQDWIDAMERGRLVSEAKPRR
jgi:hypothetical protein